MKGTGTRFEPTPDEIRLGTYLEGAVVRMMGVMELRRVNHVAGLGILAPG